MPTQGTQALAIKTPVFKFTNFEDVIKRSVWTIFLQYDHAAHELLTSYTINVYDSSKKQIMTTGTNFITEEPVEWPLSFDFTIDSLDTGADYYVRATGTTVHNISLDTGMQMFKMDYTSSSIFSTLTIENKPKIGGISIKSNIISTVGKLYDKDGNKVVIYDANGEIIKENIPFVQIDDTHKGVDVTSNTVVFDEGFSLREDFDFTIAFTHLRINNEVITFKVKGDDTTVGHVYYREGKNGQALYAGYFELDLSTTLTGKDFGGTERTKTYHRVFFSNNMEGLTWNDYKGYKWSDFIGYTYNQLRTGVLINHIAKLRIKRINNNYSLYALLEKNA